MCELKDVGLTRNSDLVEAGIDEFEYIGEVKPEEAEEPEEAKPKKKKKKVVKKEE